MPNQRSKIRASTPQLELPLSTRQPMEAAQRVAVVQLVASLLLQVAASAQPSEVHDELA
jgi:hypothetical protein